MVWNESKESYTIYNQTFFYRFNGKMLTKIDGNFKEKKFVEKMVLGGSGSNHFET